MQHKLSPALKSRVLTASTEWERVIITANCTYCRRFIGELGCPVAHELPFIDSLSAWAPRGLLPAMAAAHCVGYIEDDIRVQVAMDIARSQMGVRSMNRSGLTGKGVTIAIIDTGIYPHPDFTVPRSRIRAFVDFVDHRKTPYDDNGHGTFCAGVAAGNGTASGGLYAGVAPDANLVIIKTMDASGGGISSDVLAGMQWVLDNHRRYGIDVLSMSLGSAAPGSMDDALSRGAQRLWREGVVVVAAAGNNGPRPSTITSPGCAPLIFTVGACDDKRQTDRLLDTIPSFSGRGPAGDYIKPDIVAPGVAIRSTKADTAFALSLDHATESEYIAMTGTSVSCPIIAGCCALLLQYNPFLTPQQIKDALTHTATPITSDPLSEGAGLVDVASALAYLRSSRKYA